MQTEQFQNIISYLHRCYVEDNRQYQLLDVFNRNKVEHLKVIEGTEELINDDTPKIAITEEYYNEVYKTKEIFKKEKELLYSSVFIMGEEEYLGKVRKICAPLLLFPAHLSQTSDAFFVSIELENFRVNASAISLLLRASEKSGDVEADILKNFQRPPFDFGGIGQISRLLSKHFPKLDNEALLFYPELWSGSKLKRQLQPKQRASISFFQMVPASAIGIMSKSSDTYGILSELEILGKEESFSSPLKALLSPKDSYIPSKFHQVNVPSILSKGQEEAASNAFNQKLSIIIGPPGTGKSYTIANIAIDYLMNRKSVLITSRQDEAVDVVLEKINSIIENEDIALRAGAKRNVSKMRKTLRRLLRRKRYNSDETWYALHEYEKDSKILLKRIKNLEYEIEERLENEIKWSRTLTSDSTSSTLKKIILKTIHSWRKPHWSLIEELQNLLTESITLNRHLAKSRLDKKIAFLLANNRKSLENLYLALRSSNSTDLENAFSKVDFDVLFQTFPIWLCKLTEVYKAFPYKKDLFDLVIIDEASQCDMASILPAIQRAKKVVICGDPNQLRHVSFLSRVKMESAGKKLGLNGEEISKFNFREKSVLDLSSEAISSQWQLSFLDEHFRSEPDIIRFSNNEFYSNDLKIMTEKPIIKSNFGNFLTKTEGKRDAKGINEAEAQYIIKSVKSIIEQEEEVLENLKTTIGILSPFRAQVEFLSKMIKTQFELSSIVAHNISVGTAYSFQGEERDTMFLSFVVDKDSHHSSFIHLNKADVFNVSITRAKTKQYILHSIQKRDLPIDHLFRKYLEDVEEDDGQVGMQHGAQEYNQMLVELFDLLKRQNLKYHLYYPIAGVPIDLLIQSKDSFFGIDLIGCPGIYEEALSVNRYKILARAGIPIFPLPYTFWKFDREECENELLKFLNIVS